jgi:hypothetical protein
MSITEDHVACAREGITRGPTYHCLAQRRERRGCQVSGCALYHAGRVEVDALLDWWQLGGGRETRQQLATMIHDRVVQDREVVASKWARALSSKEE